TKSSNRFVRLHGNHGCNNDYI
ncbi:unnamed protein product, partial [Allacma fusca]